MQTAQTDWPAAQEIEELTLWDEMQEWMMVGLRLTEEGVSQAEFANRFGVACQQVFDMQINKCLKNGLIEAFGDENDRLRLTPRGRLLGNQVFMEFVANDPPQILKKD
jgi:oxygen-independent coproporphyrinogen-3 oxidase